MPNVVRRGEFYPVVDRIPYEDRQRLGLPDEINLWRDRPKAPLQTGKVRIVCMAVYTGEKRPPKAGEWFLSGSEVEAYRAPNDLSTVYHIAKLVVLQEEAIITRKVIG